MLSGFTILLCELAARVALPLSDPYIYPWPKGYYVETAGYGYRPSEFFPPTRIKLPEGSSDLVYTNSLGMKDVEPEPFGAGQERILVLGCSQTDGNGIADPQDPWPRKLEPILNQARWAGGRRVVVMNGGVTGYNSFQQTSHAAYLAERAKPDFLIRAYFGGTFGGMWGRNLYGIEGQYRFKWDIIWVAEYLDLMIAGRGPVSLWLLDHSALWRWIVLKVGKPKEFKLAEKMAFADAETATRAAFSDFKRLSDKLGIEAAVLYLPSIPELEEILENKDSEIAKKVEQICAETGLPFLNPSDSAIGGIKRASPQSPLRGAFTVSAANLHYNVKMNEIYAQAVAGLLVKRRLEFARGGAHSAEGPLDSRKGP